jgi:hypothetical protein
MSFRVDISHVMAGMTSMIGAIEAANPDAFAEGAKFIIDGSKAQGVVPVKTGKLRDSLRVISSSSTELLGGTNTIRYARIVHDGLGRGKNKEPRPYLKSNVDRFQPLKPIYWLTAFRKHHTITS